MSGARLGHALTDMIGALLFVLGLSIAMLSGACTLMIGGSFIGGPLRQSSLETLMLPLVVGGVPFVAGAACALVGWRMIRGGRPKDNP